MPITIGSNIQSLRAIRQLDRNSEALSRVSERLSSGQRINRASDDAAGLAISDSLRAKSRVYSQAIRNVNDGVSLLNITEGAVSELSSIMTRQKELAEQAANGTYGYRQRVALNKEAESLTAEYNRIVQSTTFNGINVFGTEAAAAGIRIQHGEGLEQSTVTNAISGIGHFAGAGTFTAAATLDFLSSYIAVKAVDVNNDGNVDLLASGNGSITLHLGNGDNTFSNATSFTTAGGISALGLNTADFDGDGGIDIMAIDNSTGALMLFHGQGDGSFVERSTFGSGYTNFESADFNADGTLDVVAMKAGTLNVFLNSGSGTFTQSVSLISQNFAGNQYDVAVGDINKDGIPDLVYTGTANSVVQSLGIGNGTFASPVVISAAEPTYSLALGDFNGDGSPDVAIQSQVYLGDVRVRLNDGTGAFGSSTSYTVGGQVQSTLALHSADLTDDGTDDILAATWSEYAVSLVFGSRTGTLSVGSDLSWDAFTFPLAVTTADLNNDGIKDIISTSPNLRGIATFLGQEDQSRFIATVGAIDLTTMEGARSALISTSRQLEKISQVQGALGAVQSRLATVTNNLRATSENYEAARSRIMDADIAAESSELVRTSILQQAASSVLAQANAQPQLALRLLRNV